MKTCTKCNIEKTVLEFSKNSKSKNGYAVHCKNCCSIKKKSYYENNKESEKEKQKLNYVTNKKVILEKAKIYVKNNKEILRESRRKYYLVNKEKLKLKSKNYFMNNKDKVRKYEQFRAKNNPAYFNFKASKRRAAILQRTPNWVTTYHLLEISKFYIVARTLKELTGIDYDVDHVIPLQGKLVSGLHVPWNLQVITSTENTKKGNRT